MNVAILAATVFPLPLASAVMKAVIQKDAMRVNHQWMEDALREFLRQNRWRNVLFITDKDFVTKPALRVVQEFAVYSIILVLKQNTTTSSYPVLPTSIRHIIVWCEIECQCKLISLASTCGMFGKGFSWLFVLNGKLKLSTLVELLSQSLLPFSSVFTISFETGSILYKLVHTRYNSSQGIDAIVQSDLNTRRGTQVPFPLRGYDFKIGTFHAPPTTSIDFSGSKPIFSGFNVEVMQLLSDYLGFRCRFGVELKGYGSIIDGKWTGLVGSISQKKFDLGGIALALTLERTTVVDFTTHILETQYAAVMRTPYEDSYECNTSVYLEPFSLKVWIACAAMCLFAFVCMAFAVQRFFCGINCSNRRMPARNLPWYWSLITGLLHTGTTELPERRSTQTLFLISIFFSTLIFQIYTSLLTATLTVIKEPKIYNDLDELLSDGKYGIAAVGSTSVIEGLKAAKSGTLRRIWEKMQSMPGSVVPSKKIGYAKVINEDYAFLDSELGAAHYLPISNCTMMVLKQRYLPFSVHYFFPKNSSFTETFSLKILTLRSSGILKKIFETYIPKWDPTSCVSKPQTTVPLRYCLGAFFILVVGFLMSTVCLAIELMI